MQSDKVSHCRVQMMDEKQLRLCSALLPNTTISLFPLLSTPLSAIIRVPAAWSARHHNYYYILYVRLYTVQCKASKQKEQLRFGQLTMLTLSGIANFSDHLLFLTFVVFCKSASGIAQSRTRVEMCGQMRPLEQLGRVSPTNHDRIQNHLIHFSFNIISRQLK